MNFGGTWFILFYFETFDAILAQVFLFSLLVFALLRRGQGALLASLVSIQIQI